jgi:hypothetical protein
MTARLEQITRLGLLALALTYALGVLVVSLYLARYTVSPLSLLRVQYVVAGLWLLAPIAAIFALGAWFGIVFRDSVRDRKRPIEPVRFWLRVMPVALYRATIAVFGFLVIAGLLAGVALAPLGSGADSPVGFLFSLSTLALFGYAALAVVLGWVFVIMLGGVTGALKSAPSPPLDHPTITREDSFLWKVAGEIVIGSLCLMAVLAYTGNFANSFYPEIPATLGGGKPTMVRFLLSGEDSDGPALGVLMREAPGPFSIPYKLLLTTDGTYVVLSEDDPDQALEFSKDLVSGVKMVRE